ncbi:MAG: ABC transporter ATP-binding protein [Niabella sp.]
MTAIQNKLKYLRYDLDLFRIWKFVHRAARGGFYFTIAMIFVETGLFFISLYFLKLLINAVSGAEGGLAAAQGTIFRFIILAGVAGVLYSIVRVFVAYLIELQSVKVAERMYEDIHAKSVQLDLSFYESPAYFDTLKRAMDAGADRPGQFIMTLVEIGKNILSIIAVGVVLLSIHWLLLPLLALFVLPTLLIRLYYAGRLNALRIAQTQSERESAYHSSLITSDTAAKEIRVFNLGEYLKDKFVAIRKRLVKAKLNITFRRSKMEAIMGTLSSIGVYACIGFIAYKAIYGETSIGDITLFLVAFPQTFTILQNIASGISLVYQNGIYINSIFELLDLKSSFPEANRPLVISSEEKCDLQLSHVSFHYPHDHEIVLRDINIHVPTGKIVAIVGLNGAGKSTLIKLLCRLYNPVSGIVSLNGEDIKNYHSVDYKRQLGVVFQDFCRYSFTAADNVLFGDIYDPVDEERIKEAAKKSGAHDFIEKFPDAYQTVMGRIFDNGQEVSIGQWQKIALARCFYSDARILILDEATSALDVISEKKIFDDFRSTIGNRSAVVISHRHSAVRHADYIYVLAQGKVVEEGTDEELLFRGGEYAKIFQEKRQEAI